MPKHKLSTSKFLYNSTTFASINIMDDFLRFIRHSSERIFGNQRQRGPPPNDDEDPEQDVQYEDGLPSYVVTPCKHVSDAKWQEVWNQMVEPKYSTMTGIVFLNPCFARTYYVPVTPFRCGYDGLVEFDVFDNDLLALMKKGRYEQWMRSMIRSDSCFVPLHVCSPAVLIQQLCTKSPYLTRISFHYYYLDDNLVAYVVRRLPNLVSINLENSIGLSVHAYANLGLLYRLAHLNLSGCDISENGLVKIIDKCSHLETLDVSSNCRITGMQLKLVVLFLFSLLSF